MTRRRGIGGRTAMIDIIFILLAFVVVVSTMRDADSESNRSEEWRLELPSYGEKDTREDAADTPRLRIVLRDEDAVFVGESRIPLRSDGAVREAIRQRLPGEKERTIVEIDAAPDVPLQTALRVVEALRAEHLERIVFLASVDPKSEDPR